MTVPPIPRVAEELLGEHRAIHGRLAQTHNALPATAVKLFALQQRRIVIESIAYVRPAVVQRDEQLLMVPPRAFLHGREERRMMGCTTLFRHLDSRVAMGQLGIVSHDVDRALLAILHALAESSAPTGHARETNPGMFRTALTRWEDQPVNFTHPEADQVAGLVDEALHVANDRDTPACVRAAWLTFTLLSIHPFVDGNGRTSRSTYMAVTGPSLPLGIDWGVLEQWSIWRRGYIVSLQEGQAHGVFDPPKMNALPFIEYTTRTSIAGARVCIDRLEFFARYLQHQIDAGLPEEHAMIRIFIEMWRIATLDELTTCGVAEDRIDEIVSELIGAGIIRWVPRPHSRRTFEHPDEFGLVLA